MGTQKVLKTAFNAGELSPLFEGRVDHVKYPQGLSKSRNMIPTVHGAATRRPGTRLAAQLKSGTEAVVKQEAPVLVPHEISADRNYLYEISNQSPSFSLPAYKNRARMASPFSYGKQIVYPVRRADGSSSIATAQSGDVLYLADDGASPLHAITNTETVTGETIVGDVAFPATPAINGTLSDTHPTPFAQNYQTPPFQDYRPELNRVVSCETGATVGAIEPQSVIWAPAGTFTGKRGHRIVFNPDLSELIDVSKWVDGLAVTDQKILYHQGRFYQVLIDPSVVAPITLSTEPLHEYGAIYNKTVGWKVQLGYIGNGHFSGTITTEPAIDAGRPGEEAVSILWDHTNAPKFKTARWAWAAIGTSGTLESGAAYPDSVTIFRNRLVLSAGGKLYFSRAGKLLDFNQYDGSGQVVADSSVTIEIPSKQKVSAEWMIAKDTLIVGAKVGIFECMEETTTEAFGPGNVKMSMVSTSGANPVNPVLIDGDVFYVLRGGKRLHRLAQSGSGWVSLDVSVIADHLGKYGIVELAWQNEPWKVLWTITGDGRLVGMTWNREQDVWAWHPHESGDAEFRGVACIPSPAGDIDDAWVVSSRFVNQSAHISRSRTGFVEYMADAHQVDGDLREAVYSDLSVSFAGDGLAGGAFGYEIAATGGTAWDSSELLALTRQGLILAAPPATFSASDVGSVIRALETEVGPALDRVVKDGGAFVDFEIEEFVSATQVLARPRSFVPASLRNFAAWQFRRNKVTAAHLAGQVVDVLVDGSAHPQVAADSAGGIQLQAHHNRVTVGVPCPAIIKTMRIEGGATEGTSQGQTKRIDHVITRLHESVGIKVGPSEERTQAETFRRPSDPMDGPVPAFNGDLKIPFKSGSTTDGYIVAMSDQPLPLTIISMVAEMTTA